MATEDTPDVTTAAPPLRGARDLREIFRAVSRGMLAEFEVAAAASHATGKGVNREKVVRDFLAEYLPERFGVGAGQLMHSDNYESNQCDVVIYDRLNTPRLMPNEHSLYPVESVFAVIEVKSVLTSTELSRAFVGLRSAFRVARDPRPWSVSGEHRGERHFGPFCAVFAFSSDRSLDAIREQVLKEWDTKAGRVEQPPPLIVVLGEGVVGPRGSLTVPEPLNDYTHIRRTKDLSLLRFFMHLIAELSRMHLPEFAFDPYLDVPQLIDGHRIRQSLWVYGFSPMPENQRISATGVTRILRACKDHHPVAFANYLRDALDMPFGIAGQGNSDRPTFEFNPRGTDMRAAPGAMNLPLTPAVLLAVDDAYYVVDLSSLDPGDLVARDRALEDLF